MAQVTVKVRMYHVGELGDCFLLKFKNDVKETNVLIDCGSFRNKQESKDRLNEIVAHIKKDLKDAKLDVVVGTHQHNDHVSGFVHAETQFKDLVNKVWLSWLDDPKDRFARQIYNDQKSLVSQLKQIYDTTSQLKLNENLHALNDVLGFYAADGGDPEIPSKGVEILKKIGQKPPDYLSPGMQPSLPNFNKNEVKVYVLGPPRNREKLFDKNPGKDESYDHSLALASASANKLMSALNLRTKGDDPREEEQFPFNNAYKKELKNADKEILSLYNKTDEKWRQIDLEWLEQADRLALYLDTFTNNSSLVLAFELVATGKVLLFAADAQTGNWLSWDSIKWKGAKSGFNTRKLIENTVLYKVGHHGSHNSTLVACLEAMGHEELVAMIPVDKNDPNITKKKGWKMPAKNLYKRLKEKTNFRVLRMDTGFADDCDPAKNNKSKWDDLPFKPKIDKVNQFVEYTIQG